MSELDELIEFHRQKADAWAMQADMVDDEKDIQHAESCASKCRATISALQELADRRLEAKANAIVKRAELER